MKAGILDRVRFEFLNDLARGEGLDVECKEDADMKLTDACE